MQAGKLFNQVEDAGDNFIRSQPLSAHEEDLMNEAKHAEDAARNVTYCPIDTIQKAQESR